MERLGDVKLYDQGNQGIGVFVNIDAVEAEIEQREAEIEQWEASDEEVDAAVTAAFDAAYNNRDNWVKGGIEEIRAGDDDETRYACMRVNLMTGRIGEDA